MDETRQDQEDTDGWEDVDQEQPARRTTEVAREEASHIARQDKKSALFFGSVDQSSFYTALESRPQYQVMAKFNQSGLTGFLPLSDPGVCFYMTTDFARAVTEGRYQRWQEHVVKEDKALIERFRAGQHNDNIRTIQSFERHEHAGERMRLTQEQHQLNDSHHQISSREQVARRLADILDPRPFLGSESTMHAPCAYFRASLARKGLFGGQSFGHMTMFTMAVDENGRLDPTHLIFMDPNTGIMKIPNTPEAISDFISLIDDKLLAQMGVRDFSAMEVEKSWLPQADTAEWNAQEQDILSGNIPVDPNDYALSSLCLIDDYLRLQIERLSLDHSDNIGRIRSIFLTHADNKIEALRNLRGELSDALEHAKTLPKAEAQAYLRQTQIELLDKIDTCVSKKRHVFAIGESESKIKFNELKTRLEHLTHQPAANDPSIKQTATNDEDSENDDDKDGEHIGFK